MEDIRAKREKGKRGRDTATVQPRRRFFRIGPGLIVALLAALFIGGRSVKQEMQRRQAASLPPIIERHVISSEQDKIGPVPEVKFLLDHHDRLALTEDQVFRLKKLQSEWEKLYLPKMKQAEAEAQRAGDYLSRSKRNRRTSVAQIEAEAAPLTALSAELSAARRQFWARAMTALTPQQRLTADREREADYAAKRKALMDALKR